MGDMRDGGSINRRRFLEGTLAAGVGSVGLASGLQAAEKPSVQRYVPLGKTGLEISDIGFGSGGCRTADLVRYCYERGVNHFDTSTIYRSEGFFKGEFVENLIGEALQDVRDKVVITTKQMPEGDESVGKLMFYLNHSLKRLRTDYIDIYLNQAVNSIERLKQEAWWEFVDRAKQEGKIRFAGLSGHGGMLRACLDYAMENDLVQVILVAYNFGSDPKFYEGITRSLDLIATQEGLPERLARARKKGIGVITMKTLMGAELNDLTAYRWGGSTFAQGAFRWVLSDPNVDALVISMKDEKLVDQYLAVSGQRGLEPKHARALRNYVATRTADYCRPGCDACESSCPSRVPVSDVLRQRMYALRYGDEPLARSGYVRLGAGASPCLTCSGEPCASQCPYDLAIPVLTRDTARRLG